jgi:hypothetical protein
MRVLTGLTETNKEQVYITLITLFYDWPVKQREYTQLTSQECILQSINIQGEDTLEWHEVIYAYVMERKNKDYFNSLWPVPKWW